ncbi:MAG: NAD(P)-binding protein [Planctomycetes bacterium]|nr:NAD(P)-binding protein [Planctomycetota bacterium]
MSAPRASERFDAVVVGGGFGGLGAALAFARAGKRVALCETLRYLGGCAGTFSRGGASYAAGATLGAGFAPGQALRTWLEEEQLWGELELEPLEPVLELRTTGISLSIDGAPRGVERALLALPGAPRERLARFFDRQRRVSAALWPLLDDPERLPRLRGRGWFEALALVPRLLPHARLLLGTAFRPLTHELARAGLADYAPLRCFADALCQITLQCRAAEAESPLALAAFDYYERGVAHVRGGLGALAQLLGRAIERRGGSILLAQRVAAIERAGGEFTLRLRDRSLRAPLVALNVLPGDAAALLPLAPRERAPFSRGQARVESGWGACMLYRRLSPELALGAEARHWQLVRDPASAPIEGHGVFASLASARDASAGSAAPRDLARTLTVSTHVDLGALRALPELERGARVAAIQERMRGTLAELLPELEGTVLSELSASPRTFERFTGRGGGWVGGVPRRAGLSAYAELRPPRWPRGVALVGDSFFPGQSALAAAVGGYRSALALLG